MSKDNTINLKEENQILYAKIDQLNAELESIRQTCDEMHEQHSIQINELHESLSWKLTKPLRSVADLFIKKQGNSIGYFDTKNMKLLLQKHGKGSFPGSVERKQQAAEAKKLLERPKFSILVPLYNTPKRYLKDMIESVTSQTYDNWELCLADASDEYHSYVGEIVKKYQTEHRNEKIEYIHLDENLGISGNTNRCVRLSTGDYLCPFDHDDVLHPCVLYYYACEINSSHADFLYCDELTFVGNNMNNVLSIHFKPDYAPDTLRSNNYICHLSAFNRNLLDGTDIYNSDYDGSQDYDLILRLTEKANKVIHIKKVLYYWRSHSQSTAGNIGSKKYAVEAGRKALESAIDREEGEQGRASTIYLRDTVYRVRYDFSEAYDVKIIILEKKEHKASSDNVYGRNPQNQINNISYKDCEIVHSDYENLENEIQKTEDNRYIVLMESGINAKNSSWLYEYLMFAKRPGTGAVGGKLIQADGTIYSAGLAIDNNKPEKYIHLYMGRNPSDVGYMARLQYIQNVTAVSGRAMMVKASVLKKCQLLTNIESLDVVGFDICMQLMGMGYRNIYNPYAIFTMKETAENDPEKEDIMVVISKWEKDISKGDKYMSEHLLDRDVFNAG
jgi:glycosyltransferase involved in cell wall biosynthesis